MSSSPNTHPSDASSSAAKRRGLLRPLLLGLVLAGIVWAAWQFDLRRFMSVAGMRALVDAHAPYGPLVFMAIVVAGLFTRVPMMGPCWSRWAQCCSAGSPPSRMGGSRPSSAQRPSFS